MLRHLRIKSQVKWNRLKFMWRNIALLFGTMALLLVAACSSLQSSDYFPNMLTGSLPQTPQDVALLLPAQGQWTQASNAVRNGFFSAYYADESSSRPTTIHVYDTTQKGVVSAYQQAVAEGADVVVGPLTKSDVQALANSGKVSVPTLALNSVEGSHSRHLMQYSLSPTDEAEQAAQKGWADGHKTALVITPTGASGQAVRQVFTSAWQSQGGRVVGTLQYSPQTNLTKGMAQLLNFSQDKVPDPKHPGKMIPNPQRRQDADMIFLSASPTTARLIKPLLLFYYAGDIPVYATSSVYGGAGSSTQDLSGIRFCDMPWVLENTPTIASEKAKARKLFPNGSSQYSKLYAMGLDAYGIVGHLNELNSSSSATLPGMTGVISMQDGVVHRQLDWAIIQGGRVQLLNTAQ